MTNERAVEILNLDLDILGHYGGETAEAYKMAIKALEAQPTHGSTYGGVSWGGTYKEEAQPNSNEFFNFDAPMVKKSDAVSREAVFHLYKTFWRCFVDEANADIFMNAIRDLPPVTPKYTDEEIDKAQAVEQAYVDKMVELAVEESKRPKGKWIETPVENDVVSVVFKCSECGMRVVNPYKYCPNCCAEMSGGGDDEET